MAPRAGTKRKAKHSPSSSAKKVKTVHLTADDLPWKSVSRPKEADLGDGFDGLLELEEVEDVEVVYEETDAGRVVRFKVKEDALSNDAVSVEAHEAEEEGDGEYDNPPDEEEVIDPLNFKPSTSAQASASTPPPVPSTPLLPPVGNTTLDSETLLPDWHPFSLHPLLGRALYAQKFSKPTPIQAQALPLALKGKDIVGVAETGSGKTLAYGLPILHHILTEAISRTSSTQAHDAPKSRRRLRALILAPTRELALQVSSHLNACLETVDSHSSEGGKGADEEAKEDNGEETRVVEEAGKPNAKGKGKDNGRGTGRDNQKDKGKGKQRKDLRIAQAATRSKAPPLVSVAALVGGMSAQKQRRVLARGVDVLVATPGRLWDIVQGDDLLADEIAQLRFLVLDEADRMVETGHFAEMENILRLTLRQSKEDEIEPESEQATGLATAEDAEDSKEGIRAGELQTFVFSATLSKELQRNLKKKSGRLWKKKGGKPASTLDDLLERLDFRDPEPAVVDISPEGGVVATLQESKVECLTNDKDAYLYYFLLRYPGRTLVFLSSIDGIRRLLPVMDLLQVPAFPLHSQLEQRQRLKNLDRFKSTPNAVLLATDVAARGLDVPAVDHVVHYQAPRTADAYVHRNGRTARAMRRGFALLMCAPDERRVVRALLGSLGRQDEIPDMPVELYLLDKLKARVQLARQIDAAQHKVQKGKHEKNWLKEAAEAMEIELGESEQGSAPTKRQRKEADARVAGLKGKLRELLAQPLIAPGVSTRYITSGSVSIADEMLTGDYHENMVGLKKIAAGSDLAPAKKRKFKVKEEFEEWNGIGSYDIDGWRLPDNLQHDTRSDS
ncbi:DEAD-domain-containing protein [Wolfiporia cocos MD-104 SS10]|uniref:ATP-dependent RNA helicase n=1 Tax=Wolfiporia cocos (strain MD-104) TaxID=742152 RepID=A0A2H3IZ29_WOLCO|nr:DEAD-domain-containing protein [Wolfiporia cocos MD-104 SS10]